MSLRERQTLLPETKGYINGIKDSNTDTTFVMERHIVGTHTDVIAIFVPGDPPEEQRVMVVDSHNFSPRLMHRRIA